MNQEELSALVDGEIVDHDLPRLLDALGGDAGARRAWSRYHLIGDALRDDGGALTAPAAEVVALPARRRAPLAGLAVAASVAVLAVVLVAAGGRGGPEAGLEVAETLVPAATNEAAVASAETLAPRPVSSVNETRQAALEPVGVYDQRLNGYLVNFNEQRQRLGVPGVHPYVRIVGFEAP